ncbi:MULTISPECIES: YIEGIA domain-containing protein [Halanaerobium]|uniref:YIEGIA domain-containing protein n=1 Tax=Halanaerobium TaxID=2330 RepID=UPI00280B0932|nr:YIEGIA domain-containing protein [Halanaerobium congolense]
MELYKRPKHGIKLIGSEKAFRKASASILKSSTVKHGAEISSDLKDLLKDVNLNIIQEIIQDSEVEFNYILSDISFKGLLIHLGISISRIYEENLITMERNEMRLLKKENEWKIAEYIGERLSSSFELEITDSELGFITIHLVGAKLQNDIESEKISESHLEKLNRELYTELRRIIDSISKITGYNFKQDKKLFTGLFLHLRTAVKRIKNDIRLPYIDGIAKTFESRNYFSLLFSFLTALTIQLVGSSQVWLNVFSGALVAVVAIYLLHRFSKGKTIGDIADVEIANVELKNSELYVDDIYVSNLLGSENASKMYQKEGIAAIIYPKEEHFRITLDNFGQRQAALFEATRAVGVKRYHFTRKDYKKGRVVITLVPIIQDKDAFIEAIKKTPLLENVKKSHNVMDTNLAGRK